MYLPVVNIILFAFEEKNLMPYNKAKEIEVISMKPTSIRLSDSLYEKVKNDVNKMNRFSYPFMTVFAAETLNS